MNSAILSSLSVVYIWLFYYAYKHPKAYSKRCPCLCAISIFIFAGIACWISAVSLTYKKLIQYIPPHKQLMAKSTVDTINIDMEYTIIIFFVTLIGIIGLNYIHSMLGTESEVKT
jgi:hypothetical protein